MIAFGHSGDRELRAANARALVLALTAMGMAAAGCKVDLPPTPMCVTDNQCGSGFACMTGSCIQRGAPGSWAIELTPRSDSSSATTRLESVAFSQDVTVLTADAKVTVNGTLPEGASLAGAAHMVVMFQSPIPGSTDLQVETDSARGIFPNAWFSFAAPASALNRPATFHMVPLPPSAYAQPPVTLTKTLTTTVDLAYNSNYYFLNGNLASTTQAPLSNYTARAYLNGLLASNVQPTDSAGAFRLSVPVDAVSASPGAGVTVELTLIGSDNSTIRFVTPPIALSGPTREVQLGALTLPPVPATATYRLKIIDPSNQPVSGAVVRVHTNVSANQSGAIDFTRDGVSDGSGNVDLTMLAGTAGSPRAYDVAVQPPPGSRFGSACQTGLMITGATPTVSGGSGGVASSLAVPVKATLPGTIVGSDEAVVSGVTVTATQTAADPGLGCGKAVLVSLGASTTTAQDGSFQLTLDPGTYKLDYDPAAGSSVPRLTEAQILVGAGGNSARTVRLPAGALIKGLIQDASGAPLPQTGVRFLEVVCSGQSACYGANRVSPILRGDTHTDGDGTFRVVVPVP